MMITGRKLSLKSWNGGDKHFYHKWFWMIMEGYNDRTWQQENTIPSES